MEIRALDVSAVISRFYLYKIMDDAIHSIIFHYIRRAIFFINDRFWIDLNKKKICFCVLSGDFILN